MPDYVFVEQVKSDKDILTVAVLLNEKELENMVNCKEDLYAEAFHIVNSQISWEETSNRLKNFISLSIVDLKHGPIKNSFNYKVYSMPVQSQLDLRHQSLEDFAIDDLLNSIENDECIAYIKKFTKLYSKKNLFAYNNDDKNSIGFILSSFLLWSETKDNTQELIRKAYKEELDEFQIFISKYPSLGAYHSTGKKIIEAIEGMSPTPLNDTTYFRARQVNNSNIYTHADMEAPKREYVRSEGRYNHIGIPVLYT